MTLRYRLLKAGDTLAYVGLAVLTWRFARGELHWRLAIGAAVPSAAWPALTALRHERLFATYFDVVSRLEVILPATLGIALAGLALERERAAARVRKAVEPYATFVHNEKHRLEDARESLAALSARLEDLRSRIGA